MPIEKPHLNPSFFYGPVISYNLIGGISKDKGKYRIRFSLTFKSGDVYQTQKSGFQTKKEAQKGIETLANEIMLNKYIPFDYTVSEFFDYWLYYYNVEIVKIRYNTFTSYKNILYNYLEPSIGKQKKLSKIKSEDIVRAIHSIPYESTKSSAIKIVKQLFEYAFKNNYLAQDPLFSAYPIIKKEKKTAQKRDVYISIEQIKQMLRLCKKEYPDMYLPLLLSLTTGTRISETIGLKMSDINFSSNEIYINRQLGRSLKSDKKAYLLNEIQETKTPHGVRYVPVPDWVLDEIVLRRAYIEQHKIDTDSSEKNDYICCQIDSRPFNRKSFHRDFKKLLVRLGLPDMHWHDLRHVYANTLKNNSINMKAISEYLGHSSPDFTNEMYINTNSEIYDCTILNEYWVEICPKGKDDNSQIIEIPFVKSDFDELLQL